MPGAGLRALAGTRVASCPGMETPEALAPQVVAVIVACDPGAWFEEALEAFGAQDYPELSVLVLDCGTSDTSDRVAAALPNAYVRRLESNRGYGASANAVLEMVQGASHFLFCHDDVAPESDAVSILVEESFRSNAGVVGPKFVSWDDPRRLLHVGMAVDKGGAVVDRVEPGELDHAVDGLHLLGDLAAHRTEALGDLLPRLLEALRQLLPAHLGTLHPEHAEAHDDVGGVSCGACYLVGHILEVGHLALLRTTSAALLRAPAQPGSGMSSRASASYCTPEC